jgi:hypothetical protein
LVAKVADGSLQPLAIHYGKFRERNHIGPPLELDFDRNLAVGRSF